MGTRKIVLGAVMSLAFLAAGCGGGGGGGVVLTVTAIQVTTQQNGPQSPFGTTLGGDTALLTGTGFEQGATVTFGLVLAVVVNITDTQITVQTPAGAEGPIDVTVTNPGAGAQTATLVGIFQYIAPPSLVTATAQNGAVAGQPMASVDGDTTIQITGQNLRDGMTARVLGIVIAVVVQNPTTATFVAPPSATEGPADVTITNPEGMSTTLPAALEYTAEFSLQAAPDALSTVDARHLFRRAAFGGTEAQIAQAVADGLQATVDGLMNFVNDDQLVIDAMNTFYTGNITPPPGANYNNNVNKEWWLTVMVNTANGFQERLAFFLHGHFATSEEGMSSDFRWAMHPQVQLFRRFSMADTDLDKDGAAGLNYDWRAMLVEICKDQAMLDWLDGRVSTAANPNENFARELWELFMLGEGNNYTEFDIQQAARAFTGFLWLRLNNPQGGNANDNYLEMRYREGRHDKGVKTIFGVDGNYGYDSISPLHETNPALETDPDDTIGVVAHTLAMRAQEASEFICNKLYAFFVDDTPDPFVIDQLAQQLRAAGPDQWNLKPIIRTILTSKAFFSSAVRKEKVASPVEYLLGKMRDLEAELHRSNVNTNAARMRVQLQDMGQIPLQPDDVNGFFKDSLLWLGPQAMLERYGFLSQLVGEMEDVPTDLDPIIPPPGQRDPQSMVTHLSTLLDVELTANAEAEFVAYVTSQLQGDQIVPFAYDQNNAGHVEMKARGLIWMLSQYTDGHRH